MRHRRAHAPKWTHLQSCQMSEWSGCQEASCQSMRSFLRPWLPLSSHSWRRNLSTKVASARVLPPKRGQTVLSIRVEPRANEGGDQMRYVLAAIFVCAVGMPAASALPTANENPRLGSEY